MLVISSRMFWALRAETRQSVLPGPVVQYIRKQARHQQNIKKTGTVAGFLYSFVFSLFSFPVSPSSAIWVLSASARRSARHESRGDV
jgi:hypothetical protein